MSRMDSTAAEDARNAKRAKLTPSSAGGDDDADLISGLDDDVLLRVLGLLDDARDVARTGALSRRWRGLWTRAPALRFVSRPESSASRGAERRGALERYVSFVNGVLARRTQSGCAVVETLSISYTSACARNKEERMQAASVSAVQGWIRHAFQHGVKSFAMDLCPHVFEDTVLLDGLPSPARLETMRLALSSKILRLPTTMKFASLKDLSLERITIADGGVHLLSRLVSSASCPRLHKLRMSKLWLDFDEEIRLESDVLSELWLERVNVRSPEVSTPQLKVLHIDRCIHRVLRVSAPRLEELALLLGLLAHARPPGWIEIDRDLPCVRSLKFCLWSHLPCVSPPDGEVENDTGMLLLKRCSSVTCLHITLEGRKIAEEDVDLIKSRVPQLPHITSLIINVYISFERHDFGVGVTNLLTRFSNLRHLIVHLPSFNSLEHNPGARLGVKCDHPDFWATHELSTADLEEVELTGLTGTDCELWFMKAILASSKRLRKVVISFNRKCWQHLGKMDAFERMLLDEGMRTSRCATTHFTLHAMHGLEKREVE